MLFFSFPLTPYSVYVAAYILKLVVNHIIIITFYVSKKKNKTKSFIYFFCLGVN